LVVWRNIVLIESLKRHYQLDNSLNEMCELFPTLKIKIKIKMRRDESRLIFF